MKAFFDTVRPMFNGSLSQEQVNGLNTILAATDGLPIEHRAYILATAMVETAWTMQPVRETLADSDASAVRRLDHAWASGQLSWVSRPYWRHDEDGKAWFGRGYVQLTHKSNYRRAGEELNVDLVGNPSAALNPDLAALILVRGMEEGWFTGRALGDYLPGDYVSARQVVNGLDRANEIAAYAETFERALRAIPEVEKPATCFASFLEWLKGWLAGKGKQ